MEDITREHLIASSKKALIELDKVITQIIQLHELDPEKAKAAVQGKVEAIRASEEILIKIKELEDVCKPEESKGKNGVSLSGPTRDKK